VARNSNINHFARLVNTPLVIGSAQQNATFFTSFQRFNFELLNSDFHTLYNQVKTMNLVATLLSLFILSLLVVLVLQMRKQRLATEELLADNRIRTRLYQDADESTTFILSRTIQNISAGHPDPNLESDSFTLKVVRELVKRRVPKEKWLEIQTNERLVHELYLLLRDPGIKKGPRLVRAKS
jgi:hypothetical protein